MTDGVWYHRPLKCWFNNCVSPSQGSNNIYHYLVLWYPNTGVWVCRLKTRVLQQCHNRGSYMSVMFHSLFGLRTNITPKLYITGLTGPKTVSWIIRMTRGFPSQGSSNYGMRFYINRVPCICSLGLCPSYNICLYLVTVQQRFYNLRFKYHFDIVSI